MIKIICVGKLKEKYLIDLVNDYKNRISKYTKIEIIELKDSDIKSESIEINKHINPSEYTIGLDIKGNMLDSVLFKEKIESIYNKSYSVITFIIGGSNGIEEDVKRKCNELISFSSLTFPHGLFRGILLEQIYRSYKIINNESYHK